MESKKERLESLRDKINEDKYTDSKKDKYIGLLEDEITNEESISEDSLYLRDIKNILTKANTSDYYSFMVQFYTAVSAEIGRS